MNSTMAEPSIKKLFHLSRQDCEILRQVAFDSRRSQSEIMREALVEWLTRRGLLQTGQTARGTAPSGKATGRSPSKKRSV